MAQRLVTQTDGNPIPSYVPIYDRLYADIVDGVYPAGTQLPGEAALAEKYGVSRNTLRQALTILNEDRMIRKSREKAPSSPMIQAGGLFWAACEPCAGLCPAGCR